MQMQENIRRIQQRGYNKLNILRSILLQGFAKGMKAFGVGLIMLFYMLIVLIVYSFIFDVCKAYHLVFRSYIITGLLISYGLFVIYNVIFNSSLAIYVDPGNSTMFKNCDQEYFINLRNEINRGDLNYCKKCQLFKPERCHHCSICEKCVFKMDHHCPWINQCVGHENHRYFMLMIFWLLIGVGSLSILELPMLFFDSFNKYSFMRSQFFYLVATLVFTLFFVLIFFNAWNWYLIAKGKTAIEYWGDKLLPNDPRKIKYQYAKDNKWDNLEIVFGTKQFIKMIMPSTRKLTCDGIRWTINTQNKNQNQLINEDEDDDDVKEDSNRNKNINKNININNVNPQVNGGGGRNIKKETDDDEETCEVFIQN